ncbi:serine/threonine-protein phosphatase 4 regulatory subunit 3 [Anopheles bellator]|uniref:serine/threonine-protein phosphatase 4 regulatory subunit 3 n=1 Tax=Anopheles bellator TaxID=139047 RepID=UPI00264950F9|nr:serine/threonine-protein phosphatase 4 regulatory subunit 3 [Anopheles bellator]
MTTDTRRRVKLYALNADRQWDDRGTGHVTSSYVDRVKGVSLLVHAENDGSMLLESKIQPDTIYHKQQDTLIVWSEGDNFDLALSFQEKAGCDEIWEKICQVQGKDPSVEITQDVVEESEDERFEDMPDSAPPIELPPCELSRLEDISEVIASGLTSPMRKDKLAQAVESENYIKKLLNLFHICEDLENQEGLHYLYEIFKNVFLLNKNSLFEIMFAEDTIFDVVGCLEYDPSGNPPKSHRQYLKKLVKFREAIPIRNPDLLAKIHQTYRVQYIQDIVLPTPSVFEDNMLNSLSSFIFFNKVEIVTIIQEDEKFLDDLFTLLTDPQTQKSKRRECILFLKEFCNFAQYLQPQGKDAFYKTLINLGVLPALEITLAINEKKTKAASIDILTTIVEYSPSIVRDFTLQQFNNSDTEEDQTLINIAIEQLFDSEPELGGAVQLMNVLRILLDPENMLSSANKSEKSDFLNFFYKRSIQTLIAPLLRHTQTDKPTNEDCNAAQLLGVVLELLSFCVEHHTYHIKNCIINKDLLRKILVLMNSMHMFLVLGALRFLRKIVALKDEFYNRHIIKGNLFAPVVDAFFRNNGRYNLLESAILDMFEFIKQEDIKSLYTYFVENFGKRFDGVQYVQTFKTLKTKYDQQQDRLKEKEKGSLDSVPSILRNTNRYRRDQRQMDEEEEIWFNEDEDYSDTAGKAVPTELDSTIGKMFDKKTADNGSKYGTSGASAQTHQLAQHTAVTATATSADGSPATGATSTLLTISRNINTNEQMNNGESSDSGTEAPVTSTSTVVQHEVEQQLHTAQLDPNSLSHAVAAVAAAVANNGLQSSTSTTTESIISNHCGSASSLEVTHHNQQHHQQQHHLLSDDGEATNANLSPADESALEDANSLVVSALGDSELSVYQLQSSATATTAPTTLIQDANCSATTVDVASGGASRITDQCEAEDPAIITSSVPVTDVATSSNVAHSSATTSCDDDGCNSKTISTASVTESVLDKNHISSDRLVTIEDNIVDVAPKPSVGGVLTSTEVMDIDITATVGRSNNIVEVEGVSRRSAEDNSGSIDGNTGSNVTVSETCIEARDEVVNTAASFLVAPVLDSAPAVEEPDNPSAQTLATPITMGGTSTSSLVAGFGSTTSSLSAASALSKGLVDYEGDSEDEDDDEDNGSPAQKKARIA